MKKKLIPLFALAVLFPSVTFASFDRNLKHGMRGDDVSDLQDVLVENGCLNVSPTGYFGLLTLKGVQCWQSQNGLPATGFFGPMSRNVANALVSNATASSTAAEIAETGTTTPVAADQPQTVYVYVPQTQTNAPVSATPVQSPVVAAAPAPTVPVAPSTPTITLTRQCSVNQQAFGTTSPQAAYLISVDGATSWPYNFYSLKASIAKTDGDTTKWNFAGDRNAYVKGIYGLKTGDQISYDIAVGNSKDDQVSEATGTLVFDAVCQ